MSNIRIIAGKYKGKMIFLKKDATTRPTSQRVRDSVFNIIEHKFRKLQDAVVLDLFCGTGAYGIESISRGASFATFIDSDADCVKCVHEFFAGLQDCYECIRARVPPVPKIAHEPDIIFLDPPYDDTAVLFDTIEHLSAFKDAIIVAEHSPLLRIDMPGIFRRDITKSASMSIWRV